MTREEEIKKQAEKKALEPSRLMHPYAKQYKVMSAYEIGFIEGAVWADAHPHWISVGDELPKENDYVLICNNRGLMTTSLYENEEWVISETYLAVNVTHWMPLPMPPKKGGEE